ncbi:MAG TPA: response regulator transcription factor [Frankiaceae bacterium]|nr:response regulator transcription factor [Frankiaceae bacterium]
MAVRVMVVDDTDHVRTMLAEMLELDGFEVVAQAANGDEAVALAIEADPDVIVMDLKMPGTDGLESTRRIKETRPTQAVILYTAYLDPVIEAQAKEVGVTLCLGKIDGLPELERQISRLTLELAGDA